MELIATDTHKHVEVLSSILESYDCPAILVSTEYQILATNSRYKDAFGSIDLSKKQRCFQVSHGYEVPCDQAGEDCPLQAAQSSGHKERVLHIHQTPRGKEHVDVEMLPIYDRDNQLIFFIELLKSIPLASGHNENIAMVGTSEPFSELLAKIARVGNSDASVLLLGESGTGKELAAQAIHMASKRNDKPLVSLECAGLSDALFESELFGHVRGAFTGAHTSKQGLVEQANGGTLFLDEIGDVPLSMQVKLLRLLESGTFRSVGGTTVKTANFRLVCATHKNLIAMIERGEFRQDLYYRINVFPILIPSLRERVADIPLIAKNLLVQLSPEKEYHLSDSAIQLLQQTNYKGNIRELKNLLQRAIILSDTYLLDKQDIVEAKAADSDGQPTNTHLSENDKWPDLKGLEEQYLHTLMTEFNNDRQQVAEIAGISLRSLYRKLQN